MLNLQHKNLDVWKVSIVFVTQIYNATSKFPSQENYILTTQMRRAAVSIASNIAEGASRKSAAERKRFFEIARSSLVEIDTQIEICQNLRYLKDEDIEGLSEMMNRIFGMLTKLIQMTK